MIDLADARRISMLDLATLERLQHFARECGGGIVEIGPYIGGSTLALASGHKGRKRHAVIERGGSHQHPTLPSSDILADWKSNIAAQGMIEGILLCEGWSYDPAIQKLASDHAKPIGLLFVDADGFVAAQIQAFAGHMRDDCIFAIDDYFAPAAEAKAALIKPFIDGHVADGRLEQIAVEDSTWFGRIAGPRALHHFQTMIAVKPDGGHAFLSPSSVARNADSTDAVAQSPLRLFEDGVELGPAHSSHDEIRRLGGGRFSHWAALGHAWLFWSTSDNSDPTKNGRTYEADFGQGRVPIGQI